MPAIYVNFLLFLRSDKPATTEKEADLFGSEQAEDELFSSKPKTTKPIAPPSKAKPSSDLFGASPEDDLFSAPGKPPSGKTRRLIPSRSGFAVGYTPS